MWWLLYADVFWSVVPHGDIRFTSPEWSVTELCGPASCAEPVLGATPCLRHSRLIGLRGQRVGEARQPGPVSSLDDANWASPDLELEEYLSAVLSPVQAPEDNPLAPDAAPESFEAAAPARPAYDAPFSDHQLTTWSASQVRP